jgi:CRP-like cAMP-binding protein
VTSDEAPRDDLLALSAELPTVTVEAGEALIEQGRSAPAIYVLVDGSVTLERDGHPFATLDYVGAVFGEMAVVLGRVATATVRANRRSTLRVAEDASAFLDRPGVARAVLRVTASRLDTMTQYLADVRTQFGHLDNHLGMVDGVLETLLHYQAPPARPGSARDPLG